MSDLDDLQKRVLMFRDARNWAQFHGPRNLAISVVSEAVELLDEFKWMTDAEIADHIKNNKESIADEVVDVLSNLLTLAHELDIDIPKEFERKMLQNEAKYPVSKSKNSHTKYDKLRQKCQK